MSDRKGRWFDSVQASGDNPKAAREDGLGEEEAEAEEEEEGIAALWFLPMENL